MSSDILWKIQVKNLEAHCLIGIYEHEQSPQRVIVNAEIHIPYAVKPASIKECFNYDTIYHLVTQDWPKRGRVELLETLASELLEYIFRTDSRVVSAQVSVAKPDIFSEAESVGVEASWTRQDFERLTQSK